MQYSNLHAHTNYSDGKHSIEENILSAIEYKMLAVGISDHSYTTFDSSYCIPKVRVPEYLAELTELKKKYAEQIPVYIGIEQDYFSEIDREKYDYVVGSVHYATKNGIYYPIDHSKGCQSECIRNAFGGNPLELAKQYYDRLVDHVQKNRPTVIGHFDVVTKFGMMPENDGEYCRVAREALLACLPHCKYVEMNTGAMSRGVRAEPYPSADLLKTILENGGEIVLGSDSHRREHQIFYFDESVQILKKVGFDHISVFNGTGFNAVNI